jgi:hypothetical protein
VNAESPRAFLRAAPARNRRHALLRAPRRQGVMRALTCSLRAGLYHIRPNRECMHASFFRECMHDIFHSLNHMLKSCPWISSWHSRQTSVNIHTLANFSRSGPVYTDGVWRACMHVRSGFCLNGLFNDMCAGIWALRTFITVEVVPRHE